MEPVKKTIHPAKVYLRQVAQLRREIAETKELLSRLREQSTRATSRLSAVRCSGTGQHDSMANAALKIIRNEEKLVEQIAHLEEAVAARMALIAQLEDPRERRVLELRYLHGLGEDELCRRMGRAVHHALSQALQRPLFLALLHRTSPPLQRFSPRMIHSMPSEPPYAKKFRGSSGHLARGSAVFSFSALNGYNAPQPDRNSRGGWVLHPGHRR